MALDHWFFRMYPCSWHYFLFSCFWSIHHLQFFFKILDMRNDICTKIWPGPLYIELVEELSSYISEDCIQDVFRLQHDIHWSRTYMPTHCKYFRAVGGNCFMGLNVATNPKSWRRLVPSRPQILWLQRAVWIQGNFCCVYS